MTALALPSPHAGLAELIRRGLISLATVFTNAGAAIVTNRMIQAGTAPKYIGWGTGTNAAAVTDTTLQTEAAPTTSGGRTTGTESRTTVTNTNDAYTVTGTVTAAGTVAITEVGLFDAATTGNLLLRDVSAAMNLVVSDSIGFTLKLKLVPGLMDDAALAAEIAKPAYAGMDDAAIAAAINAGSFAVAAPIRAKDIKQLWGRRMILARCWTIAGDVTKPAEVRTLCRATYDNLMGDLFGDLDPADPTQADEIAAYLAGLVAAGAMTEKDRDDTLALATAERRGAVAFLGRPVDESDIANARATK